MIETTEIGTKVFHLIKAYDTNNDQFITTILVFDEANGDYVSSEVGHSEKIVARLWYGAGVHYGMIRAKKNADNAAD